MTGPQYRPRGTTPYSKATSGRLARDEITRLLHNAGCDSIGFMDDFERHELILEFRHRGRKIVLRASALGWAAVFLKNAPHNSRMKLRRPDYEAAALHQGQIAINSILRDWVKGQVTAIECGVFAFDTVFMPYMLLPSGRTIAESAEQLTALAGPENR